MMSVKSAPGPGASMIMITVALNEVPTNGISRLLQEPGPASLLSAMQRERGSKVLYLGYPICINRVTSRKGEHFYRLEPGPSSSY